MKPMEHYSAHITALRVQVPILVPKIVYLCTWTLKQNRN